MTILSLGAIWAGNSQKRTYDRVVGGPVWGHDPNYSGRENLVCNASKADIRPSMEKPNKPILAAQDG